MFLSDFFISVKIARLIVVIDVCLKKRYYHLFILYGKQEPGKFSRLTLINYISITPFIKSDIYIYAMRDFDRMS